MNNQKGFANIALIIFFVVIVGVLGYVILAKKLTTPVVTEQPSETADWKTYRNEKYGFEVKYPPGWIQCPTLSDRQLVMDVSIIVVTLSASDKECYFSGTDRFGGFDTPPRILEITEEIAILQEFNTIDTLKMALERARLSIDKLFEVRGFGGLFEVGEIKDVLINNAPALEVYEGSPAGYEGGNAIYIFRNRKLLRIFSSISYEREKEKTMILSTFKFTN